MKRGLLALAALLSASFLWAEITSIATPPGGTDKQLQYNKKGGHGGVTGTVVSGSRVDFTSATFGSDGSKSTFTSAGSLVMPVGATVDGVDVSAMSLSLSTGNVVVSRIDLSTITTAIGLKATIGNTAHIDLSTVTTAIALKATIGNTAHLFPLRPLDPRPRISSQVPTIEPALSEGDPNNSDTWPPC